MGSRHKSYSRNILYGSANSDFAGPCVTAMGIFSIKTQSVLRLLALVALLSASSCNHDTHSSPAGPTERILPPPGAANAEVPDAAHDPAQAAGEIRQVSLEQPRPPEPMNTVPEVTATPQAIEPTSGSHQTLDLPTAIGTAFQLQPKLRVALESIQQARAKEDIAFSAFLPLLGAGYSVGNFDLNVGGQGIPVAGTPYTFLAPGAVLPVGLNVQPDYTLAELKLQWLVCDFGRRMGHFNQAGLAADIAELQSERAYQTIANEVATAYYQVLRVRSLHRIASEAVRRAADDLDVAGKLAKGGVIEREKLLRAQVALAQAQRLLDLAEEGEAVAIAALNLAIGLNPSLPTDVVDSADIPPFTMSLADCLQTAVACRREFQVARKSISVAQEGSRAARADFAPKIVAEGDLFKFDQTNPGGHAGLGLGFIKLEWGLFEGGRRIAELHAEGSRIREAMAQADAIADTIAFEVNQSYRQLIAARKGIDRAHPAVEQTLETYRLVTARARQGDATPAELTDAQTAATRAQQDYFNAIYDYLTALAKLEFAMGATPTPATARR
jgi:outer membrane protein